MNSTDQINETIRSFEPGAAFLSVDESQLGNLTQGGWRLVGAFMEKRFHVNNPGYSVPQAVCRVCQHPVVDGREFRDPPERAACNLVEMARFLLVREPDDVIAGLHEQLERSRKSSAVDAADAAKFSRELEEASKELSDATAALEGVHNEKAYLRDRVNEAFERTRFFEKVIGRARDELGAARWRELVGDLEDPADEDDDEDDDE